MVQKDKDYIVTKRYQANLGHELGCKVHLKMGKIQVPKHSTLHNFFSSEPNLWSKISNYHTVLFLTL